MAASRTHHHGCAAANLGAVGLGPSSILSVRLAFAPAPAVFGLPAGSEFLASESAVSTRRYAPWNAHLGRRDLERQAIEAGSVLSYQIPHGIDVGLLKLNCLVGLWREVGLGRVWLAPEMLAVRHGDKPNTHDVAASESEHPTAAAANLPGDHELIRWTGAMLPKGREPA